MTEPSRLNPIRGPVDNVAIARSVIPDLERAYLRLEYPPEPRASAVLLRAQLRELAGPDRELWAAWRENVVRRRGQNESRLLTLLWARDVLDEAGDEFGADTLREWLRSQWGVSRVPDVGQERHDAVRRIVHPDIPAGRLDPESPC